MNPLLKSKKLSSGAAPFSVEGYLARAKANSLPLDLASWMLEQPVGYGIEAGRLLDKNGAPVGGDTPQRLVGEGPWKEAAVLIPVLAREPEVTVLLTLRPTHLTSHPGQIAFPGGKIEPSDKSPIMAALREAEEEVGLPEELVTPIGLLDLHRTGTGYRIVPVLSLVDPSFIAKPDPDEVAEVFEAPLSWLMSVENHIEHRRPYKDGAVLFHAMNFEGRVIWGATSAIIKNLYERLYLP